MIPPALMKPSMFSTYLCSFLIHFYSSFIIPTDKCFMDDDGDDDRESDDPADNSCSDCDKYSHSSTCFNGDSTYGACTRCGFNDGKLFLLFSCTSNVLFV